MRFSLDAPTENFAGPHPQPQVAMRLVIPALHPRFGFSLRIRKSQ